MTATREINTCFLHTNNSNQAGYWPRLGSNVKILWFIEREKKNLYLIKMKHNWHLCYSAQMGILYTMGEKNPTNCELCEQIMLKGRNSETEQQSYTGTSKIIFSDKK
jgi:hypothetical protein